MKKFLCLLVTVVMCVSFVACSGGNSTSSESSESSESVEPTKPSLDVEQELVNICCDYSNCNSVKGFEIGTNNKNETEDGWIVEAKGSYWPVDEYGNIEDLMTFDIKFTATWNGGSYYSIDVDKKVIRKKY